MFTVNDKVVYPGHGVAKINRIIQRSIAGKLTEFFELKFLDSEMTILVPVSNLASIGVRKICSDVIIKQMFAKLDESASSKEDCSDSSIQCGSNWGKRLKKYQGKISTGDLLKICDIYRDLKVLATQKELSFGEKNLLHKIEHLLAQEISIATEVDEENAVAQLRSRCKQGRKQIGA